LDIYAEKGTYSLLYRIKVKGDKQMRVILILYISICLMQVIILTNITLFDGQWNGITMWLCTAIFIFSSTVFSLSGKNKDKG